MTKVIWKGASIDPEEIEQYGVIFPKGESVDVPSDHPQLPKLRGNPHFEVEEDPVPADDTGYKAVHRGRGVYAVIGPNGFVSPATFTKDEATAFAAEKNVALLADKTDPPSGV